MATNTTNLNLIKPSGTDKIRIAQINQNMDILDEKIGAVGNTSLQAQITALNSQKVNKYRVEITNQSVITATHISDAVNACATAGYRGAVAIEFYRTDQGVVTATLWYNITSAQYGAGVLTSYYNDYMYSVIIAGGTVKMKEITGYAWIDASRTGITQAAGSNYWTLTTTFPAKSGFSRRILRMETNNSNVIVVRCSVQSDGSVVVYTHNLSSSSQSFDINGVFMYLADGSKET